MNSIYDKPSPAAKRAAARELIHVYNNYETRKVTLPTLMRKIYYSQEANAYKVSGKAHDYSQFLPFTDNNSNENR